MSKSAMLRFHDLRDAYRLIGECRDLGSDSALWYPHMLEGLCRLIGAAAATGGEGIWRRPHRALEAISAFGTGFDVRGRELYAEYMRQVTPGGDPVFRALQRVAARQVTRTRKQLISDSAWHRSVVWNEFQRPAKIDDELTSVFQIDSAGAMGAIVLHRAPREREFSARDRGLLSFFHAELGPLMGRMLTSASEPRMESLPPRLRQTLACLMEGDSEKQAASRLGLSVATTHEYVTALYRRFKVRSRAQLMAHVIRRRGLAHVSH
jgi:DNA-binding CsgD family transcriptional regulator